MFRLGDVTRSYDMHRLQARLSVRSASRGPNQTPELPPGSQCRSQCCDQVTPTSVAINSTGERTSAGSPRSGHFQSPLIWPDQPLDSPSVWPGQPLDSPLLRPEHALHLLSSMAPISPGRAPLISSCGTAANAAQCTHSAGFESTNTLQLNCSCWRQVWLLSAVASEHQNCILSLSVILL